LVIIKYLRRAVIAATFMSLTAHPVFAQMALPGAFEVTPNGAAAYSIPIQVLPGTAGMEPKLALVYNSGNGNGLLGVGWSLSGLPLITRCPRTTPQDGIKGTVAYDSNDRFCLDGRRLMVTYGTYGADKSVYGTELETFVKVTAYGVADGGGPLSFIAVTKEGLILEFGNTADSRLPVLNKSPAVIKTWAVNRISDAKGNSLIVRYLQATGMGSLYPTSIAYTVSTNLKESASNTIDFGYESRPDKTSGFQDGFPFSLDQRLSTITIKSVSLVVSSYKLNYQLGASGRSRIRSIVFCAPDGKCAPTTTMDFIPNPGLIPLGATNVTTSESSPSAGFWFAFDTNGDGRSDLVHMKNAMSGGVASYATWRTSGAADFTIQEFVTPNDSDLSTGQWMQLDINGDGLTDLVHLKNTSGVYVVWISNGDGSFTITQYQTSLDANLTGAKNSGSWLALDVNGDGFGDMIHFTGTVGEVKVWKSNGIGNFSISQISMLPFNPNADGGLRIQDVDGDGLADLVSVNLGPVFWKSNGDGTFAQPPTPQIIGPNFGPTGLNLQLDLNGDGLVDSFFPSTDSGVSKAYISKGNGTWSYVAGSTGSDRDKTGTWQVLDLNGDGLQDLIHHPSSNAGSNAAFYVWESKGDGTFNVYSSTNLMSSDNCLTDCIGIVGDFQGNGLPGFVRLNSLGVKSIWQLGVGLSDIPSSISNGAGEKISWTMDTLPSLLGNQYTKDTPSDSQVITITPALGVVAQVNSSVGFADSNASGLYATKGTKYYYTSARLERNGRGFLGFSRIQSLDSAGLLTKTDYRQDFPYIGLISRVQTGKINSSTLLSSSMKDYNCFQPNFTGPNAIGSCSVAAGNRYITYPSQIDSRTWDLDGSPLPRSRVENSNVDAYGNVGTIVSRIFDSQGLATDYSKVVNNTFFNFDDTLLPGRTIGRLVKSVVTSTGPTVAAPVIPGSGGLPDAPPPELPSNPPPPPSPSQKAPAVVPVILQLLLSDS
jgi:hypothetical protein